MINWFRVAVVISSQRLTGCSASPGEHKEQAQFLRVVRMRAEGANYSFGVNRSWNICIFA